MKTKEESVVFVFYTFSNKENSTSWSYTKFPKGWSWVGSGSTSALGDNKLMYENEEQFSGPKETQSKLIAYLTTFFNKLKEKNQVKKFKIRLSYLP